MRRSQPFAQAASDTRAAGRGHPSPTDDGPKRAWPSAATAFLIIAAGLVPMMIGTEPYSVQLSLGLADQDGSREALDEYRRELVLHVSDVLAQPSDPADLLPWRVDVLPEERSLLLSVSSPDPTRGVSTGQRLVRSYLDRLDRLVRERVTTVTHGQAALMEVADSLQQQIGRSATQTPRATAAAGTCALPTTRQQLTERVDAWRVAVTYLQSELRQAEAQKQALDSAPPPQKSPVSAERRTAAQAADVALTQDLAELSVKLTELRASMLSVWQSAAPLIEELTLAAARLIQAGQEHGAAPAGIDRIIEQSEECHRWVEAFAGAWNREFAALRQDAVDPIGPSVVEVLDRCTRLRNDLLFNVSTALTALRGDLRSLEQGAATGGFSAAEQARQHRLTSALLSEFHALEKAYQHFELATGALQPENNPRLDAAQRAARGLRRRTQTRIQQIDDQLALVALHAAQQSRAAAARQLDENIGELRSELSRRLDEGLVLQANLVADRTAGEDLARTSAAAEVRRASTAETARVLDTVEAHLKELTESQAGRLDPAAVKLLGVTVQRQPINLTARITRGWLAASGMLVLLLLVPRLWRALSTRRAVSGAACSELPGGMLSGAAGKHA
ncbi:MAG TPA: hypothetical protein VGM03_24175 [Phycisphaerae bacterium]